MKDGTFTANRLLALYDRVADSEDAIPRLRRFVLDLAVRGKLVEQDSTDEPAGELLKRIAEEKVRLVKVGEIRKPKLFEPVGDAPFGVPCNWTWSRIREVTTDRGQMIPNARFTYIDVSAINKEAGIIESPTVLDHTGAPSRARKIVRKGDVIYSCVRPYLLNVAVVEEEIEPAPIASTAFAIINGLGLILPRFIWIVLRSPFMIAAVEKTQRGQAYPAINDADFAVLPFPLPPVAEQQRIVANVDELMALCDRLEAARAEREAVRNQLTAATWARLTSPEADAETFPTHARFAVQTLPTLTTREGQLKTLRQAILNLAVRGKLVEQDPTDEPAAELLKATVGKKTALPKVGEEPFEVPPAWMWVDFEAVAAFENGDRGKNYPNRNEYKEAGIPWINTGHIQPDGSLSASAMHFISREKFNSLGGGKIRPGDMLYCLRGATFGKTAFVEPYEEGAIASSLMIIRPGKAVDRRFTYYYLTSPFGRSQLLRFDNGTAQPNLSSGNVKRYRFPLPPIAEQQRIVAKVDALMALCDQLEASLTTATTTRSRLLKALMHEALGKKLEAA